MEGKPGLCILPQGRYLGCGCKRLTKAGGDEEVQCVALVHSFRHLPPPAAAATAAGAVASPLPAVAGMWSWGRASSPPSPMGSVCAPLVVNYINLSYFQRAVA